MQTPLRTAAAWALVLFSAFFLTMCAVPTSTTAADMSRAVATGNANFTANVMAPLKVTDWTTFDTQLQQAKDYGIDAVSADVWWGDVEKTADNSFDWSYYDTLFSHIKAKGLKLVPIFSFHQCGGNVGDTYTSLLPSWLWTKYTGATLNGVTLDANGLKHKSEQGNYSAETVQGWADSLVLNEYSAFASAFASHFVGTYGSDVQEINVSLGPAGELRYPSYNSQDTGTGYPSRGALQMYSPLAVKDFQNKMIAKYTNLAGVNAAWGTTLTAVTQIQPPSNPDSFFTSGDYKNIKYGKDLIDWYNQSLVDHGKRLVDAVAAALGSNFSSARLGYKVPGVHWAMTNPSYPRAAEVAAGLVQTSVDLTADATGHGYQNIIGLAKTFSTGGRSVVLHFTCLEMDDQNYSPQYSQAKTLVFWVAQNAAAQGVMIKGENALSGGVTSDAGWNNIVNAFDYASYVGLTTLRIGDVVGGTGQNRYLQFIARYRPTATVTLRMTKDVGVGNSVFFSGSVPALTNWGTGTQGTWTTGNTWVKTITNPGVAFQWKTEKGATGGAGSTWEAGSNHDQSNLWPAFNGGY
jgi:hypothetical protein